MQATPGLGWHLNTKASNDQLERGKPMITTACLCLHTAIDQEDKAKDQPKSFCFTALKAGRSSADTGRA